MDVIADIHLNEHEPETAQAWTRYLHSADFDALFILGDLFEVWVGDDLLDTAPPWLNDCIAALRAASQRAPVYLMHGNRDFLIGEGFHAQVGTTALPDPCLLDWQVQRWLLTHGDAWCLDDRDYQRFRAQVRTADWQTDFLARPLAERLAIAQQLRQVSKDRKAQHHDEPERRFEGYADVDSATAAEWLQACDAPVLVHGHTHRPAEHRLPGERLRLVLSDWDAQAHPPRGEVLRLYPNGHRERRPLPWR